jgi:hypothetical protein
MVDGGKGTKAPAAPSLPPYILTLSTNMRAQATTATTTTSRARTTRHFGSRHAFPTLATTSVANSTITATPPPPRLHTRRSLPTAAAPPTPATTTTTRPRPQPRHSTTTPHRSSSRPATNPTRQIKTWTKSAAISSPGAHLLTCTTSIYFRP